MIFRTTWLALILTVCCTAGETGFTLMSFNVWKGLSQVDEGFQKGVAAIRESGADVVGLQEAPPELAQRLAGALGWHRAADGSGTTQLISRLPIEETISMERLIGARLIISESPRREAWVFNCHLDYRFYGPYAAGGPAEVLAEEMKSDRARQMTAMLAKMRPHLAGGPVFLTGDFNCPSHLDVGSAGRVVWPATRLVADAGFTDSFRAIHPDAVSMPGNTWSAIHKEGEPQDRIDFTWHLGQGVSVAGSRTFSTAVETTVGKWAEAGISAQVKQNTWPSDHHAVVTTYRLAD